MYSLVALGFVLIYKASGVFNFAQGSMVFFAALTLRRPASSWACRIWLARAADARRHGGAGLPIERLVLRPLVNQPQITLFMATIGLSSSSRASAQLIWGSDVRSLELGIADRTRSCRCGRCADQSKFDLFAAALSRRSLVAALALFFQ